MKKLSTDDRIRFAERRQKIEYELYRLWNEDAEIRRDELLLSENGVSIEDATNEQINDATARTRKKKLIQQ